MSNQSLFSGVKPIRKNFNRSINNINKRSFSSTSLTNTNSNNPNLGSKELSNLEGFNELPFSEYTSTEIRDLNPNNLEGFNELPFSESTTAEIRDLNPNDLGDLRPLDLSPNAVVWDRNLYNVGQARPRPIVEGSIGGEQGWSTTSSEFTSSDLTSSNFSESSRSLRSIRWGPGHCNSDSSNTVITEPTVSSDKPPLSTIPENSVDINENIYPGKTYQGHPEHIDSFSKEEINLLNRKRKREGLTEEDFQYIIDKKS